MLVRRSAGCSLVRYRANRVRCNTASWASCVPARYTCCTRWAAKCTFEHLASMAAARVPTAAPVRARRGAIAAVRICSRPRHGDTVVPTVSTPSMSPVQHMLLRVAHVHAAKCTIESLSRAWRSHGCSQQLQHVLGEGQSAPCVDTHALTLQTLSCQRSPRPARHPCCMLRRVARRNAKCTLSLSLDDGSCTCAHSSFSMC